MTKLFKVLFILLISISFINAQNLEKTWQFESIKDEVGTSLFDIVESDTLVLNNGRFNYSLQAKNNLKANGDYVHQNNILMLYYDTPKDTIRHYRIKELTDSTLVFTENKITYTYKTRVEEKVVVNDIIPSQGFTMTSLWRGALGMIVLLLIAYLLSKNR